MLTKHWRSTSWKGPYWEPRDIWVGVYWANETRWRDTRLILDFVSVYICLLPCLPIRLRWYRHVESDWHAVALAVQQPTLKVGGESEAPGRG